MNAITQSNPFALLQELEQRGRAHVARLPAQEDTPQQWAGIAFRVGGERFVAHLGQVTEILPPPPLSPVPRTKSWLRGLANVRGALLPVTDLGEYLGGRPVEASRHSRVLVFRHQGAVAGLLVDEVLGMRHFLDEEHAELSVELRPSVQPYVAGEYRRDGECWPVFSIRALAEHPQFLQVAG